MTDLSRPIGTFVVPAPLQLLRLERDLRYRAANEYPWISTDKRLHLHSGGGYGYAWSVGIKRSDVGEPLPKTRDSPAPSSWAGLFNLVAGIIDHHILGLHHVLTSPSMCYSMIWLFLGIGGQGFNPR
jgi:hypothetical protein